MQSVPDMILHAGGPVYLDKDSSTSVPEKRAFYLDIGCGTGNYTIDLNRKGLKFYGVDPSAKMLEEAMFKSQKIKWLEGTAESIAVENNIFCGSDRRSYIASLD